MYFSMAHKVDALKECGKKFSIVIVEDSGPGSPMI
jgi:hypothetical protein